MAQDLDNDVGSAESHDATSIAAAEVALPPDQLSGLRLEQPSAPKAPIKDWVQLKSGEWLRGVIKRM